ncbi:hypothetical protein BGZ58_003097 [Dissophora ornata]|nr:hypothetical protein BGZ58_003097 [Dissophora ornata]
MDARQRRDCSPEYPSATLESGLQPDYSLGDLDTVFSYLRLEKTYLSSTDALVTTTTTTTSTTKVFDSQTNDIKIPANNTPPPNTRVLEEHLVSSGDLGDLSRIFQYLQAHRKTHHPHQSVDSTVAPLHHNLRKELLYPNRIIIDNASSRVHDESFVLASSDAAPSLVINDAAEESMETTVEPSQEANTLLDEDALSEWTSDSKRRINKGKVTTRKGLPIDEPSSSGGWASSESDHKEGAEPEPATYNHEATPGVLLHEETDDDKSCLKDVTITPSKSVSKDTEPASTRPSRTFIFKKKRPWQATRALKHMKILFLAEQQQLNELRRSQQLERPQRGPGPIDSKPHDERHGCSKDATMMLRSNQEKREISSCEMVLTNKPRSHYKNFWRSCTLDTEESESEAVSPMTSTQCLSEEQSAAKQLLAMKVRDTFLAPKGTSLLEQALSKSETDIVGWVVENPSAEDTHSDQDKIIIQGSSEQASPDVAQEPLKTDDVEEPMEDDVVPSDRVFIFVDNSNILTGFYQYHQQHVTVLNEDNVPSGKHVAIVDRNEQDDSDADEEIILYPICPRSQQADQDKRARPTTSSAGARMVKGKFPIFNYGAFFDLLRRNRFAARRVLVGSAPLFQELDMALEHRYETIILRRVRKFVQGELGAVPIPTKQLRYRSGGYAGSSIVNVNTAPLVGNQLAFALEGGATSTGLGEATKEGAYGNQQNHAVTATAAPAAKGEQGVDELLHLKMMETLLDHEPATMVVATGDGGDSEFGGGGFYAVIKRALDRGWQVEMVSWEDQLSGVYLELALEYGFACDDHGHKHGPVRGPGRGPGHGWCNRSHQKAAFHKQKEKQTGRQRWSENGRCNRGHLRVWCLDWCSDQFMQDQV